MDLRQQAAGEIAASRAKDTRIEACEKARAQAETREAAHHASAEMLRSEVQRLQG